MAATRDDRPIPTSDAEESEMTRPTQRHRGRALFLWGLQLLAAAEFLWAGARKLTGATGVDTFEAIGVGQWFRYLTGTIEVGSALLLLLPSLAAFGALALAATMVGAVLTKLFITAGSPVLPLALLAVTTTIATLRWGDRRRPWRRRTAAESASSSIGQ
jgi:putative oxidoreductase